MSNLNTSTLRPGLLVSLKTSVSGNVRYVSKTIEGEHRTDTGAERARWETERTIIDPAEHDAAKAARSKARTLIAGVCAPSDFGLLCPIDKAEELSAAVAQARQIADEFNGTASITRVSIYVITGKIADNDVEAVRAINSEVRELMSAMESGVRNLDVEAVRRAATKAKALGQMLTAEAQEKVKVAIDAARATARKINAAGESAAIEIDRNTIKTLREARTAFLDIEDAPITVVAPVAEARPLDFDTSDIPPVTGGSAATAALEME
jgi:hypothetical protein